MKTQNEKVLDHMKDYGSITTMEAFKFYGITRLSARVHELRLKGFSIKSEPMQVGKNQTVAKYSLNEG